MMIFIIKSMNQSQNVKFQTSYLSPRHRRGCSLGWGAVWWESMSSLTRRAGSEKEPEDLLVRSPGLVLVSLSSTSLGLREVAIGDLDKVWL